MHPGYLAAIFNIAVAIGLPLAAFIYMLIRRRKQLLPFFVGAAAFAISQVLLRIPLLKWLSGFSWFTAFAQNNTIFYIILLSLSAGIFEETARWLCMKYALRRTLHQADGLAFGMGHGGFEAIYLLGIPMLNLLLSHSLQLRLTPASYVYAGGVERIFAILLHIGLTLFVLHAVNSKQPLWLLVSILLHGAANAIAVLVMQNTQSILLTESLLACIALAVFAGGLLLTKEFKENLPQHEKT